MIISGSLNSSISNADWATKKNGNNKHEGLSKYASDIEIWNGALSLPVWDENAIKDRAEKLAAQANEVWKVHHFGDQYSYKGIIDTGTGVVKEPDPDFPSTKGDEPKPTQDHSRFSLDGVNFFPKSRFVQHLVRTMLERDPSITFEQLKALFPNSLLGRFKHKGVIVSQESLNQSGMKEKDKKIRYNYDEESCLFVSGDGVPFFVCNQWSITTIQDVIKIAETMGLKVTQQSSPKLNPTKNKPKK